MNTGTPLVPLHTFMVCRQPTLPYKNTKQHVIHSALLKPDCDRDMAEQLRLFSTDYVSSMGYKMAQS